MYETSTKFYNYICIREPFEKFVDSPLSLLVGNLLRCGDGLFFEVPPLLKDALLTTLHPLLANVLQTVFCRKLEKDSGTGGCDLLITSRFIFHVRFSVSKSASTTRKPQLVSLHRLHRLDGWFVGFLIHFFKAELRIQSRNADAPPS
jgi:hypothetical protein